MKFKSSLLAQASGSVGGSTYSHNKGGMYIRNRSIPTNPNTTYQQAIRSIVGQLTDLWLTTLTAAQRAAWDAYAAAVPILDSLGESRAVTGLNMYVRSNTPRLQAALPRVDDGPTIQNLGDYTAPAIASVAAAADTADVSFTNTDDWANEDDAALLAYFSRPKSASINFFKGPYRYADKVDGDSVTPPTSPATIALPFPVEVGHRVFGRLQVSRADGRLSQPTRLFQAAS